MQQRILTAELGPKGVEVTWDDRARFSFPYLWLRDHCRAPESYDQATHQRKLDTFALPPDLRARAVALSEDGGAIAVTWPPDGAEGPVSRYDSGFLRGQAFPASDLPAQEPWPAGWVPKRHAFPAVLADDNRLAALLGDFWRDGIAVLEDLPSDMTATRRLAERIGYVRETIFGGVWDFQADGARADSAYSDAAIGLHSDGTYSEDPPGLQALHCLAFDGEGAFNVFADAFRVAARLQEAAPEAFELLTEVAVPGQYIGDGVHLEAWHPTIGLDRRGALRRICFNPFDRAPFPPQEGRTDAFYDALRRFNALVADEAWQVRLQLRPGLAVIFDNWRVLHARTAFTGRRHMAGFYLNREDVESRLRRMSRRPPGPLP